MASATSDLILRNYPLVAKDLLSPVLEFLRISRETCGDSDQALVLFAIAIRSYEHGDFRHLTIDQITSGSGDPPPSLGTNVRSLAESLGIPRETVRRRVHELVKTGLVLRHGHEVMLSARGLAHLTPSRQALAGLAARCFQIVSSFYSDASSISAAWTGRFEVCDPPTQPE